jgi:predicted PurR-regulated permease PerM
VRVALQVLAVVSASALALWILHQLASLLLVLIIAGLFAYVIAPMVAFVQRPIQVGGRARKLSRGAAIAVVYVALAAAVVGAGAALLPTATQQVDEMIARAPAYGQSIVTWEHGWSKYYGRLRIPAEVRQRIDQSVVAADEAAVSSIKGSLFALLTVLQDLPWLVLVPILAFFFLKDVAGLRRSVLVALPHGIRLRSHRLFEDVNATLAAFVRAQLLSCVIVGVLCGLGFASLGIPYPVLLGALAGVLEFIPLVGPLVVAIVAGIVGGLHSPALALWAVSFLAVLRLVQDYVIYPRLIRHGVKVHPLAVIIAVLAGAELDGVAGMFLAVPTVAILSVVYRHWLIWRGEASLVSCSEQTPAAQS